jgi:hypothetical protein
VFALKVKSASGDTAHEEFSIPRHKSKKINPISFTPKQAFIL